MSASQSRLDPSKTEWAEEYPFASHFFETDDGHELHYLDEGPRDAPVLLMLHGNPTWSFYWREIIAAFRSRYRCIAPDHLGCGLSDKPQDFPYRFDDHIGHIGQLADHLELDDVTLLLHDWGGAIGMGWAGRHPERVRALVVFNTAAFRSERIPASIDLCRIPGFGALAVRGLNGFVRAAQFRAVYDRRHLAGPVGRAYRAPYDSWANRVAILRFVEDIPMYPDHPSYETLCEVEEGLSQFRDRPVLIVWGDDDFCFDPEFRREWERRFPDAEVHAIADAGHFVVEEATASIVSWMGDFLERHVPATPDG